EVHASASTDSDGKVVVHAAGALSQYARCSVQITAPGFEPWSHSAPTIRFADDWCAVDAMPSLTQVLTPAGEYRIHGSLPNAGDCDAKCPANPVAEGATCSTSDLMCTWLRNNERAGFATCTGELRWHTGTPRAVPTPTYALADNRSGRCGYPFMSVTA